MEEFEDAEQLPVEEPVPDSLPSNEDPPSPATNEVVRGVSIDQKEPTSVTVNPYSVPPGPETPISAKNLDEWKDISAKPPTAAAESHDIQDQSEAILSTDDYSPSVSDNSTNSFSQSTTDPSSDPISPILTENLKESKTTESGPAPHSSIKPNLLTSNEISNDLGIASENATNLPSETNAESNSVGSSDSSVNSIALTSQISYGTGSVPEQPKQVTFAGLDGIQGNGDSGLLDEPNKTGGDMPASKLNNHKLRVENIPNARTKQGTSTADVKKENVYKGLVDTTAPFESVKEAVSRFGGIVDWKAHRAMALERRKKVQLELVKVQEEIPDYKQQSEMAEAAKAQVLEELASTERLVEELKLNFEKAQTEEAQAKQDSELAQLRAVEMEQGIADEASVAAKQQLEVARARHEAAITELKSVKKELEGHQKEYISLLNVRDTAIQKAEEAVIASKEIERTVEELTLELITAKESLESAHAAHLEAEEHRIGAALARDQDYLMWEKELKQAEEELQKLNEQLSYANDLKQKLESASNLLLSLNSELATYMESKLQQESGNSHEEGHELKNIQQELERTRTEVNVLKVAESSLKLELEKEKAGLATMRQREGMASIAVSSVEAEIERTREAIKSALEEEEEARVKMTELPKLLQQAAHQSDLAKAKAQAARDELKKAKDDAEQAKATATTTETRLHAALKEIEAAKASEHLALMAIRALQESEGEELGSSGVTLPLEEYYTLSKRAHEMEELSNERVTAAIAQIEAAKESESKTLEMLEAAHNEMNEKREAMRIALEKAEKAKEGKLGVEQELRQWRADEQRRRSNTAAQAAVVPPKSPVRAFESEPKSFVNADTVHPGPNKMYTVEKKVENEATELSTKRRKKKKSFFPRLVMFLARKKAESL